MQILIFLIIISLINCDIHINETMYKIKFILNKYKSLRLKRCLNSNLDGEYSKMEKYAKNTLNLLKKTERYGEYLSFYNISNCDTSGSENSNIYKKEHIVKGLLVHDNVPDTHWEEYKAAYNKIYDNTFHEISSLKTWKNNLKRVAKHNKEYLAGKRSFSLHLNHFGDWPIMSYFKQMLKLIKTIPLFDPAEDHGRTAYHKIINREVPERVDWRDEGFRPRLEEQYHCGACYAFAVAHAVQAQLYKKHGDWRELSPQQIVDCSFKDGNLGCDGGSLQAALRYAARDGLIMETYYPYIGKQGRCHYNSLSVSTKARRWATLPSGDEDAMELALATIGPLAVAVNAAPFTFQLYRSGIYDDPFCVPWNLNHAMLLVGYTSSYWILLNWWGKQWGENGYMSMLYRIRRGNNICGVANMATYVEL